MKENIEEDIKRLDRISKYFNYSMWEEDTNALRHILSDYKRALKENEELKEENEQLKQDEKINSLIKKIEEDSKEQQWIQTVDDEYLSSSDKAMYAAELLDILERGVE